MKNLFFAFCFVFSLGVTAQNVLDSTNQNSKFKQRDSIDLNAKIGFQKSRKAKKENKITIEDYKIISLQGDTTYLDTTLTIEKEYKYNILRRDDFELMSFANVGQQYNQLGKNFNQTRILPNIGAEAKHVNYLNTDEVDYYHVPTPMTELFFKTVFEQGQYLDALLTLNTSERFNASVAFNGFRSLGKYQYEQAQSGRFRTTFNYRTQNNRYWIKGHFAAQNIEGEESGGLSNKEVQFESGAEDFLDRSRIDVFFNNANSRLLGRRYFLNHQYNLVLPRADSVKVRKTRIALQHQFAYESKYFQFRQSSVPTNPQFFGEAFVSPIDDKNNLETTHNQLAALFANPKLGQLKGLVDFYNYNYFTNNIVVT